MQWGKKEKRGSASSSWSVQEGISRHFLLLLEKFIPLPQDSNSIRNSVPQPHVFIPLLIPLQGSRLSGVLCKHIFESGTVPSYLVSD